MSLVYPLLLLPARFANVGLSMLVTLLPTHSMTAPYCKRTVGSSHYTWHMRSVRYVSAPKTILATILTLAKFSHCVTQGTTQNTLSQSLLQQNRSAASLNKNHLRAAKDYFEQALRLDKSNHVARSFIEKVRSHFLSNTSKDDTTFRSLKREPLIEIHLPFNS